jgi:hypothetical protein
VSCSRLRVLDELGLRGAHAVSAPGDVTDKIGEYLIEIGFILVLEIDPKRFSRRFDQFNCSPLRRFIRLLHVCRQF